MTGKTGPRMRAMLLLVLVGACGFVGGILAERVVLSTGSPEGTADWPGTPALIRTVGGDSARPRGTRIIRLGLPEQMAEELDLSPKQRDEIERIVAEDQARLRDALQEFEPRMAAIVRESRERIFEVLTDEQVERWRDSTVIRLRR